MKNSYILLQVHLNTENCIMSAIATNEYSALSKIFKNYWKRFIFFKKSAAKLLSIVSTYFVFSHCGFTNWNNKAGSITGVNIAPEALSFIFPCASLLKYRYFLPTLTLDRSTTYELFGYHNCITWNGTPLGSCKRKIRTYNNFRQRKY